MTNIPDKKQTNRRQALALALGAAALAASVERAQAKSSLKAAKYQARPNDGNSCGNCRVFQLPSDCTLVESPVARNGWCVLWTGS